MVLLSTSAAIMADLRGDQQKPPLIHAFVMVGQYNMVGHGILAEDTVEIFHFMCYVLIHAQNECNIQCGPCMVRIMNDFTI